MTWLDLPLTCGSVQAEALCDVHAQSARTVQPGDTSGTPLAVPPIRTSSPGGIPQIEVNPDELGGCLLSLIADFVAGSRGARRLSHLLSSSSRPALQQDGRTATQSNG